MSAITVHVVNWINWLPEKEYGLINKCKYNGDRRGNTEYRRHGETGVFTIVNRRGKEYIRGRGGEVARRETSAVYGRSAEQRSAQRTAKRITSVQYHTGLQVFF